MKLRGTPIPGYTLDKKTGKPVKNKKALPAHLQIVNRTKKRVVAKAQAIGIRPKGK